MSLSNSMILEIAVRIGFYKHSKAIITKMICLIISTNADIFSMNFVKEHKKLQPAVTFTAVQVMPLILLIRLYHLKYGAAQSHSVQECDATKA